MTVPSVTSVPLNVSVTVIVLCSSDGETFAKSNVAVPVFELCDVFAADPSQVAVAVFVPLLEPGADRYEQL